MNIIFCAFHLFHEGIEFLPTVCKNPDIIIVRQHGFGRIQIIKDQTLKPLHLGRLQPQLPPVNGFLLPSYRIFDFVFDLFHLKHPALSVVLAYYQIEKETDDRNEIENQKPGPDCRRISPLKENNQDGQNNVDEDEIIQNP